MKVDAIHEAQLILGAAVRGASTGETGEVLSPANGEVVGHFALATAQDVDRAVRAASRAFGEWSAMPACSREALLRKATGHVRRQADEIARLMTMEQGKPLAQARGEVLGACDCIDYYAAEGMRIEGCTNPTESPNLRSWVIRQPVGVCAAITPWNYPVALLAWKLGPALAAGCTVVAKPSPVAPLSPFAFCQALRAGGLPNGAVNLITGKDRVVGKALVEHPLVAKLSMTGSTRTGRELMRSFGPTFKKISLELGGHCPAIVCEDADLAKTARAIAYKAFRNMGQSCSAINRIYAHRDVHDELVRRVRAEARRLHIGDVVQDHEVDLGPMTTRQALKKVRAHVSDALERGATIVLGGEAPAGCDERGHFYLPTILTGMNHEMLMMREETFGPVAPFMPYDNLDQAVAWANDTMYGLVSYLFTRDIGRALKVAERLEAGTVCVNNVAVNTPYGPYQGWKESGVGLELSRGAVNEYLQLKHIKMDIA